ncbi:hypothetical protein SAMN05192565_1339 [Methylobacterium gossipiicola]|uniref:Uncharacterized protein n=1 Tax=Methylobacterium gossipiicola TaxID=582675 RepID=A0A1I2X7Z0_9HYPH|nr:hypothetical protein SAMN05192565_1339 [Methylobacterium gossipiicola]
MCLDSLFGGGSTLMAIGNLGSAVGGSGLGSNRTQSLGNWFSGLDPLPHQFV